MRTLKQGLAILLMAAAMPAPGRAPDKVRPSEPAAAAAIEKKEFGLFEVQESGRYQFTPAKVVPHITGQNYGWRIWVGHDLKSVSVKYELRLPAPAQNWGAITSNMTVSADRTSCTYVQDCSVVDGYISNIWSVAEDDPKGPHQATVWMDGKLVATFQFTVGR